MKGESDMKCGRRWLKAESPYGRAGLWYSRIILIRGRIGKGSVTVEASFIVPIIVIVTAALLTLTFYVHNRCWYTNAALESAMLGNARFTGGESGTVSVAQAGREAENRAGQRIADQTMPGTAPVYSVKCERYHTTVTFSGQEYSMFAEFFNGLSMEETVDRIWPVWQIRAAGNARRLLKKEADQ